jgi:phosphoglycerate dehydrogenase-like enzyme
MTQSGSVPVVIAVDLSDALLEDIRAVSPRLHVERHFPTVPERAWDDAEIVYTINALPQPDQAPRLRWVQLHSAGFDHVLDHPLIKAQDVEVTSTSGIHAVQMAEYCLAMMLAFNYNLPKMLELKSRAEWPQKRPGALHLDDLFRPYELRGQTLGIVGYGSVGRELARVADALGMKVLAIKRDVMHPREEEAYREPGTGDPEGEIPARLYPPEAIQSLAREADYLVLTIPLTAKTRHMIDAQVLASMKPTGVLINVARGPVVDEKALISALAAHKIRGAALDVFDEEPLPSTSPLWNLDNVIISPHVSGNSRRYHEKAVSVFIENLERYLNNRPLLNRLRREQEY